jgi:hypothetical protein
VQIQSAELAKPHEHVRLSLRQRGTADTAFVDSLAVLNIFAYVARSGIAVTRRCNDVFNR